MLKKTESNVLDIGPCLLALLVFAGQLKAIPALSWLPLDLTFLCALALLGIILFKLVAGTRIPNNIFVPIVLWVAFLLPIAISPLTEHAQNKISILFSVTAIAVLSPFFILINRRQIRIFLTSFVVIGIFAMALTLFSSNNTANAYTNRLTLEGVNTIGTAQMVCAGAIVSFLGIFSKKNNMLGKTFLAFLSSAMLFVALLSGSRGPVLAAVMALLFVIVSTSMLRRYFLRAVAGIFLVLGTAVVWASFSSSDGLDRLLDFLGGKSEGSAQARIELWEYTLRQIADSPLGIGWGGFQTVVFDYPHNLLLEIAVEAGLVIALLTTVILIMSLKKYVKNDGDLYRATLLALFIFSIANSMVSSDLNGNRLVWIMLATAWATSQPISTTQPECKPIRN